MTRMTNKKLALYLYIYVCMWRENSEGKTYIVNGTYVFADKKEHKLKRKKKKKNGCP